MTATTLESVSYYKIRWEDESNMCGTYGNPVAVTKSELWEYMEHLYQEELYFHTFTNEPLTTFTAVEISEKDYMESCGPFEADTDEEEDEEWDEIEDQVYNYTAINVLRNLGFLDRHKVHFSMWDSIVCENLEKGIDIETIPDLFMTKAIEGECILRVDGWFGENVFYSPPMEDPIWLYIVLYTELGIRDSGDTDHCFMEQLVKTEEVKDGLPVYKVLLGS